MPYEDDLASYSEILDTEINLALKKTSLYTSIMGLFSGISIVIMQFAGIVTKMEIPIAWAFFGGISAFFCYILAKKKLAKKGLIYLIIFVFSVLPTSLYVFSFYLPSGPATYITGPASYLYFFMVLVSGFTFNEKLSLATGIFCGIQYFIIFLFSMEGLEKISTPDILQLNDLKDPPIYFFKSMMMAFGGLIVGIITKNTKKFLNEILIKEKEKSTISRLFGQFVSEEVKEKILNQKNILSTERKKVAILFSDIRNFTSYSEKKSPEEIVNQLNAYFDRMVECIINNGGTIDKFIGDAVMAVFGGILELESPCRNALNAAASMCEELKQLNAEWQTGNFPIFEIGIGIHYGEVLQGAIGSKDRLDFTVIGDTVNAASRIEGLCKEFQKKILFSRDVFDQLGNDVKDNSIFLGQAKLKGKENELNIYTLKEN